MLNYTTPVESKTTRQPIEPLLPEHCTTEEPCSAHVTDIWKLLVERMNAIEGQLTSKSSCTGYYLSSSTYHNAPSNVFSPGAQSTPQPASSNTVSPVARLTPQPPPSPILPPTTLPEMTEAQLYGMTILFEAAYGSLRKERKEDESVATLPLSERFEAFGVAFDKRKRQRKAVADVKDSAKEVAKMRRAAGKGNGARKEAERLLVELDLTVEFKGLRSIRSERTGD